MTMKQNTQEATAKLVRRDDGWRIQIHFDDGTYCEQENEPFATKEQAEAVLAQWIAAHGITEVMKAQ